MLFCLLPAGNATVVKFEEKPPKPAFQNGTSGSLYLKPLVPRAHAHLLKTPSKGMDLIVERRGRPGFLSPWLVESYILTIRFMVH